jgi:Flp pilus assembly protein TadB
VIILSALLAGFGTWLLLTQQRGTRLRSLAGVGNRSQQVSGLTPKTRLFTGIVGGLFLGWTFGGTLGAMMGAASAGWFTRQWALREKQPDREHEQNLVRDAPVVIDLLCAALVSGATIHDSLVAVRDAVTDSPIHSIVERVVAMMDLGASPAEAWAQWVTHPVLGRLAQSIVHSHDSGAALVDVMDSAARELRREHQRRVERAARSSGVKAVIPLAVCFLPAFFALGVVPIVASLASSTGFFSY